MVFMSKVHSHVRANSGQSTGNTVDSDPAHDMHQMPFGWMSSPGMLLPKSTQMKQWQSPSIDTFLPCFILFSHILNMVLGMEVITSAAWGPHFTSVSCFSSTLFYFPLLPQLAFKILLNSFLIMCGLYVCVGYVHVTTFACRCQKRVLILWSRSYR